MMQKKHKPNKNTMVSAYVVKVQKWIQEQPESFTLEEIRDHFKFPENRMIVVRRWIKKWEVSGLITKVCSNKNRFGVYLHSEKSEPGSPEIIGASLYTNIKDAGIEHVSMNECIDNVKQLIG